ncbi:MAG TPA: ClpXP protease specificity-enhancing factor [Steroidobacteraceae bacterium]|jgi:stringent starvation protein B|nr:ClpXP protease specificity-enhancing factor [Steroidobacteraceae bacterium]
MGTAPTASVSSRRPYLLRAMHEWISDNRQTPHLVVDAEAEGVEVPRQYVKDGKIILNVSHHATTGLKLGNEAVDFTARFGGAARAVHIPIRAVLGIYARESGQGMIFNDSDLSPEPPTKPTPGSDDSRRPRLKVVK